MDDVDGISVSREPLKAVHRLWQFLGTFAAFAILNQLGSFFLIENQVSVFYPASAVSVVCCVYFGPLAAVAVLLATVGTPWNPSAPLWQLVVSGLLNALEGLIPWSVFRFIPELHADLRNKRSLFAFLLSGTILNSAISAIVGNLVLIPHPAGKLLGMREVFIWWVSDFSAALLLATPLLAFAAPLFRRLGGRREDAAPRLMANAFEVTAVIILVGWVASTAIRTSLVGNIEQELVASQEAWLAASTTLTNTHTLLIQGRAGEAAHQLKAGGFSRFPGRTSALAEQLIEELEDADRYPREYLQQHLLRLRSTLEATSISRWKEFDEKRHRMRRVSLLMDLTVLPILLLAAGYLVRAVSKPLVMMHRGIQSMATGETFNATAIRTSILEIRELAGALDATSRALVEREHQLIGETEKAVLASRHKSEFLAKMSHELRTPLNAIIGFSELLLDQGESTTPEKRRAFLKNVHNSGIHLLRLINDLLDLARLEAGRMRFEFVDLDARQIVVSSVAAMYAMARRKKQEIRQELDEERLIIRADSIRIEQILLNLLSNASKFSPEGSTITISAKREGEYCVFEVRDQGIGITDNDQSRIFEEFEQLETPVAAQGTGLGLSLVRHFAEAHGGDVAVESVSGVGSAFRVRLPLVVA